MAPDERARLTLYAWMQDTADEEKAEALMASLPPTQWADLATKQDLELLEHKLIAVFRGELTSAITAAVTSQTRAITLQVVSLFVAFAGLTLMVR